MIWVEVCWICARGDKSWCCQVQLAASACVEDALGASGIRCSPHWPTTEDYPVWRGATNCQPQDSLVEGDRLTIAPALVASARRDFMQRRKNSSKR